ncbi:CHASE3 domain-containing protein, partial [Aurantimonas sp. C2-4-R8]|nr:CHASE3 domain-containing protein [Aurantimonas sp. C2-4-R8]
MPRNGFSITKKISLSLAAVMVIVLIVSSLNFMQSSRIEDSIKWNNHTYKVLGEIKKIESSIVNQETGLRGYLVSAKENFLEPYTAGAAGLTAGLDSVQTLTSDNATQQERIGRLRLAIDDWHTKISEKEIALMGSPLTMEQARALESSGAGKALMDNIRGVIGELYDAEASLLTIRGQQAKDAMAATEATLIGDVPKFVELRRSAFPGWRLRGPGNGGNGLFGEALLMGK